MCEIVCNLIFLGGIVLLVGVLLVIALVMIFIVLSSFLFKKMFPVFVCALLFTGVFHFFVMPVSDIITYGKIVKNSYLGSDKFKIDLRKRTVSIVNEGYQLRVDAKDKFKIDGRVRDDKVSELSKDVGTIVYTSQLFKSVDGSDVRNDPMLKRLMGSDPKGALYTIAKKGYRNGNLRMYSKDGYLYIKKE